MLENKLYASRLSKADMNRLNKDKDFSLDALLERTNLEIMDKIIEYATPFPHKVTFTKNEIFVVPKGVKKIRVSGCASGGAPLAGEFVIDKIIDVKPQENINIVVGQGNTTFGNYFNLICNFYNGAFETDKLGYSTGFSADASSNDGNIPGFKGGCGGAFGYGGGAAGLGGLTHYRGGLSGTSGKGLNAGSGGNGGSNMDNVLYAGNGKSALIESSFFIEGGQGIKPSAKRAGGNGGQGSLRSSGGGGGGGGAYPNDLIDGGPGGAGGGGGAGGYGAGGGQSSTQEACGKGSPGVIIIEY